MVRAVEITRLYGDSYSVLGLSRHREDFFCTEYLSVRKVEVLVRYCTKQSLPVIVGI